LDSKNLYIDCVSYRDSVHLKYDLIKTIEGRKWSATEQVWKIPYSKDSLQFKFLKRNYVEQYTKRLFQKFFKNTSPNTLKQSFATYLLEHGTDLRYIQEILEHKSSKTPEIYTHITASAKGKIKSPLDNWD